MSRHPLLSFFALGAVLFVVDAWLRPPAAVVLAPERIEALTAELDGEAAEAAVQAWIDEELLVREARRLGLDEGDPIVRRRLVQKVRFLHERAGTPSDEALELFLAEHAECYTTEPRWALQLDAATPLPHARIDGLVAERVWQERFGLEPATVVDGQPVDTPFGPITVTVLDHSPARLPELAEIRERVAADWAAAEQEAAGRAALAGLRADTPVSR